MFDKQSILKNVFKPEEKLVFSKALDRAYSCIKNYEPAFTEFLDPYKISCILNLLGNKYDFNIRVFGGIFNCERQKIGFFPEFMLEEDFIFPISAVEIEYNLKYSKNLTHRDFLGSLIGLGIVRGKLGDILIEDGKAVVFVDSDIADFINSNLEKVGHTKVKTKIISIDDIKVDDDFEDVKNITLSSLRIDTVLSGVFNLSRGKAAELIKAEKAFVNWNICESVSRLVSEGDIITLRGFGRVKIVQFLGKTKKDKFLVGVHRFM